MNAIPMPAAPDTAPLSPADLLTEREAARALTVAVNTLRNWRWKSCGPRYVRVGLRAIRYRRSDLESFLRTVGDADKAA